MSKLARFVRLDFITVKPYYTIKNLIIFAAVALVMIVSSGSAGAAMGIVIGVGTLYVSYPFAIGEKAQLDFLYATLSISRGSVVLGRYLFALLSDMLAGLFSFLLSAVILILMKKPFDARESLLMMAAMLVVFSIMQAIQLPIYFKLGYTKAKFAAYLPFLGIPLAVFLFEYLFKNTGILMNATALLEWVSHNTVLAVLCGILLWFGLMALSFQASSSFYKKRDF